ncbi:MAG: hypothetical protein LBI03_03800 [Clostridiales bacterium]|jgi:hypothetical protein|nr:hypothetical protein [Clostridiales bacterium]
MTLKEFIKLNVGDRVKVFGKSHGTVARRFCHDVWIKWDDSVEKYGWNDAVSTRFNCYQEDANLFELINKVQKTNY